MSKQNDETLYVIHYIDDRGKQWFEGVTNNFDAWLKENNEDNVYVGMSEEDADDFIVEEVEISYFEDAPKVQGVSDE
tara:strand:- start:36 stop:266 length:231 start_codon:yes stop_codon:yes gene_type:complete